jgi:hypothetical protein
LLTEEQKLKIIEDLNKNGGYKVNFSLFDAGNTYVRTGKAVITARDPAGNYKGFIALGEDPELGKKYVVQETELSKIPGLELDKVTFGVTRYSLGKPVDSEEDINDKYWTG